MLCNRGFAAARGSSKTGAAGRAWVQEDRDREGCKSPHKHKDPRNHAFWTPPYVGPWNHAESMILLKALHSALSPKFSAEVVWRKQSACTGAVLKGS